MNPDWRRVPMPEAVARLPRNSAGRPVPANVEWVHPHDDGEILVDRNHELGAHITCPCTPGLGTPRFGKQCAVRQRQFMLRRQCGLCTRPIEPTEQVVFVGEPNAPFYLEPSLHDDCAAYALQVCPVLHAAGERIEVALTHTYTLAEDRITGVSTDGTLRRQAFPLGAPADYHLGILEFYLAFPDAPRRLAATTWMAERAPEQRPASAT
jgi:hypothetical protein